MHSILVCSNRRLISMTVATFQYKWSRKPWAFGGWNLLPTKAVNLWQLQLARIPCKFKMNFSFFRFAWLMKWDGCLVAVVCDLLCVPLQTSGGLHLQLQGSLVFHEKIGQSVVQLKFSSHRARTDIRHILVYVSHSAATRRWLPLFSIA